MVEGWPGKGPALCLVFGAGHCEGHRARGWGQRLGSSPSLCRPAATQALCSRTPACPKCPSAPALPFHHKALTCPAVSWLRLLVSASASFLPYKPPPAGPYLAAGSGSGSSPSRGSARPRPAGSCGLCGWRHGGCLVATGPSSWLLQSAGAVPM